MVDYSRILYRSRLVAVLYLVVTLLFFLNGTQTNGSLWLHVGGISFSWHFIMYLSIPIFGMLLYQYRRQKKVHLLIPIAFMVVVLLLFWYLGNSNLVFANILLMAVILLTYAIAKGWYPVKIKRSIGILWGCCIGIPLVVGGLMVSHLAVIQGYAARRLSYFFEGHGPHAIYGTWRPVREILQNTYWFGGGQVDMKAVDATSILSDYVLLHVAAFFGIFFLVVIIALLGLLCVKLFHLSMKQKNQAGAIIGIACGLIFTVQIAEYVLMNLGLIPGTTVFLPLFSYGGSGTVVSFILLGLLLSIYRYQNLVMEPKRKKRLVIKVVDM